MLPQPDPARRVAAVIVAWNGGEELSGCVDSLLAQTLPDLEIVVVDNKSTDGSIEALEARLGDRIRVVRRASNGGYGAGANSGWRATDAPIVTILNQDLTLEPTCLERMLSALLEAPGEVLVTPKVVLRHDPATVNAVGNGVHLSGVAWCHGGGTRADDWHGVIEVTAISGAAFMARRSLLATLGGLEEAYFMYMEDVDLSLRARIAGATCLAACDAVATHGWSLRLNPDKFGLLERNRRWMWQRLLASKRAIPVLIEVEAMSWAYAALRGPGHLRAKANVSRQPVWGTGAAGTTKDWAQRSPLARTLPYEVLFPGSHLIGSVGRRIDRVTARISGAGPEPARARASLHAVS